MSRNFRGMVILSWSSEYAQKQQQVLENIPIVQSTLRLKNILYLELSFEKFCEFVPCYGHRFN